MNEPASTPGTAQPKPAPNQRWRDTTNGQVITLASRYKGIDAWLTTERKVWHDNFFPGGPTCRLAYVDTPSSPGVPMGERANGHAVKCIGCGGDIGSNYFHCGACVTADPARVQREYDAWMKGARNFPRPPPPPLSTPVPDWARWLPPGPLPDTGPKNFKPGQVWAHTGAGNWKLISRIDGVSDRIVTCSSLAGCNADRFTTDSPAARQSVLVADVGCEPTPPEVLYGSTSVPAKWEVGQRRRGPLNELFKEQYEYEVTGRREETNIWGPLGTTWWVKVGGDYNDIATVCEAWPSTLVAPSSTSTRATGAEATVWEHSSNGLFWRECQKTSDVCGHQYTRRKGEAGASAATTRVVPQMGEKANGYPVACLRCGGEKEPLLWYVCQACDNALMHVPAGVTGSFSSLKQAWAAGERDFPRSKPQTDSVAPQKTASSATWQNTNVPASAFQILQGRERDRAARRAADAAVLATFVDYVDLIPDALP